MLRHLFSFLALSLSLMAAPQETFQSFTGKVTAKKVRVRLEPNLEGAVFSQATKEDLFLVVGEEGDFYAISPPQSTKAYVFRSYVLDGTVEANRVNIRLQPHLDAPILGQLKLGDQVKGVPCASNHKWLEIPMPQNLCFFIAKDYVSFAGGSDHLANMQRRKTQVEELLNSAFVLAKGECDKAFEEMQPQPIYNKLQTILDHFPDFPQEVTQAKEALLLLKNTHLNKKIAYLEAKAELTSTAKQELLLRHKEENEDLLHNQEPSQKLWDQRQNTAQETPAMHAWDNLEEALYVSWSAFHTEKKMEDFYQEQKANAVTLTGTVELYDAPIKNKPGDFLLKGVQTPLAYLYSTKVNLQELVGKEVTVLVSARPNNHFAFPAYFVLNVE